MKEIDLTDKKFHSFIDQQIKYRYQCKDYQTLANQSQLLLAGPDLYRFYNAYINDNTKHLPTNPKFIKSRATRGCRYNFSETKIELYQCIEFFDLSPISILQELFVFNCFHIAYNIDQQTIVNTNDYFSFISSGEIEVSSCKTSEFVKEELEIIETMNLKYFNKDRERAYFKLLLNYKHQNKQEYKLFSFFLRLQINKNKKLSNKVRKLSTFPNTLKWIIETANFNLAKFTELTKDDFTSQILEKFEYVVTYRLEIVKRLEPKNKTLDFISRIMAIYPYIKKYPNFVMYLIEKQHLTSSELSLEKVNSIINNQHLIKKIFDELDNIITPLEIDRFKHKYNQFKIKELLSFNNLKKEGAELNHCLGTLAYFDKLQSNYSRFFSITSHNSRSTIELVIYEHQAVIAQHKSYLNKKPNIQHQLLATKLVKYINKHNLWSENDRF